MLAVRWICAVALLAVSPVLFASKVQGVSVSHHEPLQRLSLQQGDAATAQKLRARDALDMRFDAMGRSFVLDLQPNTELLASSAASALVADLAVYRGSLADSPGSWARIVVADGQPRGLIWDGSEMFAVEAAGDSVLAIGEPVIYRLADVTVSPGQMTCGASSLGSSGAAVYSNIVREISVMMQRAPGATDEIRIAAIGDAAFTADQGGNAAAAIATRINNVDGIYSQQLAVQITADLIETFDAANDPFSAETNSGDLLDEVADYRFNNSTQRARGLTHLFTGKNLDGSTAGVAFVGALCSNRFGAGLAEARRGATLDSLISAHEIGHNFGASHDGDPAESCPNEPTTFIMAPSVGANNNTFSPCSVTVMAAEAAGASCVTPLADTDVAITANGQPGSVLLGNAINLTFDISNGGTENATGVAVNIALPNNVTFLAAAASQGSCTNGANGVDCAMGTLGGGSSGNVTVTTTTDSAGPALFTGTVDADIDSNAGNDQASVQVNVDAAVDLVANVGSVTQVAVNGSANVVATLENESPVPATNVTVSVALDTGISASAASWTAGNCTVAAQQVDCVAATLSAQSMSTLTIAVDGVSTGTRGYTITMGANETESVPANNTASGSVNVTAAGGGGSGGGGSGSDDDDGGGAAGWWTLSLLAALVARRRRYV